ncbi:MAG: glycoside hydrolase family 88 protein [Bacteroidota bacterium]|nr:glycoside hydrolase family 88 protein [Bacteroidota bacterium]
MNLKQTLFVVVTILLSVACTVKKTGELDMDQALKYCHVQVVRTLSEIGTADSIPRNILKDQTRWNLVPVSVTEWTVGFWPGILWYDYENTKDEKIKKQAVRFTELLDTITRQPAYDHDIGFQIFTSYGNAYRLTGKEQYKDALLRSANTLATLFNAKVGTILSWPREVKARHWPHNTIMDNMLNLELLFWAAKNGGGSYLYDIAVSHATTTMKNQFRPDYSCYHVAIYDTIDGHFIKGVTHQGYSDNSMWARGQAWAIYGFTMVYRETKDPVFLRFVEKVTDVYLRRLPADHVPYWDFDTPDIPNAPKDASAAAIVASALLDLSQLEDKAVLAKKYEQAAIDMLTSLTNNYQGGKEKPSFLLHSTGHFPNHSEIDVAINYADYYYLEALTRLKRLGSHNFVPN